MRRENFQLSIVNYQFLRRRKAKGDLDDQSLHLYSTPAMKNNILLPVSKREASENVKTLRREGSVPGVIYGNKTANQAIKCKMKDLHVVYLKAGENTLVEIDIDGTKVPSLIHSVSFEPVSGQYEHVDFYAVDMTKKVKTHVPVVFTGESPAVKGMGGILVTVHDRVTVSCLPNDIPHQFTIDLGVLENFRDSVTIAKLGVPKGVTIEEGAETVIVTVQEPRAEEEVAPVGAVPGEGDAAAAADGAAPAAGADGTAPAAGAKADDKGGAKKEEKKK
jgi:large subunit ribosomal protein L25